MNINRLKRTRGCVVDRRHVPRHMGNSRQAANVSTIAIDHRCHRRVEFFLVPDNQERVPVWVFKPTDAIDSIAGLVMNVSEGGLQVLSASDEAPDRESYEIQLLLGEEETVTRFRGRVTRIWTHEASAAGWLSGFRFEAERSSAEDFIQAYLSAVPGRHWVRCFLVSEP